MEEIQVRKGSEARQGGGGEGGGGGNRYGGVNREREGGDRGPAVQKPKQRLREELPRGRDGHGGECSCQQRVEHKVYGGAGIVRGRLDRRGVGKVRTKSVSTSEGPEGIGAETGPGGAAAGGGTTSDTTAGESDAVGAEGRH